MGNLPSDKHPVIYQSGSGAIELRGDVRHETIWATRMQMAQMFDVQPQAITKHIQNIYAENELNYKGTSSKMELVQNESGRIVHRTVDIYNLDIVIAVGYRINSVVGTKFRQWATKTLRSFITQGFVLNKQRIAKNYQAFQKAVDQVRILLPKSSEFSVSDSLSLVTLFAQTWFSLDAYDKEKFTSKTTKKAVSLSADELLTDILLLKKELGKTGQAMDVFALERSTGSLEGIIGNVLQSFDGKDVYPSIEEKASQLLYFIVKNHPFVDGNKRSGAYAFVWFLRKAGVLNVSTMTPFALTALTLLVAESNPKDKDKMTSLVKMLIHEN